VDDAILEIGRMPFDPRHQAVRVEVVALRAA
jgi:hypothetical protein